ncbi:hypothetical protein [Ralstonia mannitolilytica]|uniref:hypothetical protein n=1 Tax=Ralstonia mannitolilytica TaxID=105219 RepID=UPI003747A9AE
MFSTAKNELRELLRLVVETERYDATLAARPEIEPTAEAREDRMRKEQRKADLMIKYELDR